MRTRLKYRGVRFVGFRCDLEIVYIVIDLCVLWGWEEADTMGILICRMEFIHFCVVGSVWESVELPFFAPRSSVLGRYHRGFVNYGYLQEGSSALNKGI